MTSRRNQLGRERIVESALALVGSAGMDGLTMRSLARSLGVEPMSLYHWFPSRDHLLDALLDRFIESMPPVAAGPDWRTALQAHAVAIRRAANEHPALFPYVAVHRFNTRSALARLEAILDTFVSVLPDPARRAAAFRLWIHWLVGFNLDETSGFSRGPSAQEPPSDEELARDFPLVAALAPFNRSEHFDRLFDAGLDAVIAAIDEVARHP